MLWVPQGERGARREYDEAAAACTQAALPFWEMFHPLEVPTGEVMEGKRHLLQDCDVPHRLLQANQPKCLETEHKYRLGAAHTCRASGWETVQNSTHCCLVGKKTGFGVKHSRIRILALPLVSQLEILHSQPCGHTACFPETIYIP